MQQIGISDHTNQRLSLPVANGHVGPRGDATGDRHAGRQFPGNLTAQEGQRKWKRFPTAWWVRSKEDRKGQEEPDEVAFHFGTTEGSATIAANSLPAQHAVRQGLRVVEGLEKAIQVNEERGRCQDSGSFPP